MQAGVVLAGGRSTRMGESKAGLEWHGSTLLYRAAAVLGRAIDGPVVVVAAPSQDLPPLPPGVGVVEDPVAGQGPLQGLAAGLAAVAARAEAAFVCSTDLPFLHPAFVRLVLHTLTDDVDVALPVSQGFRQPLAAAYRTALAGLAGRLLAEGTRKLGIIFEHCRVVELPDADPESIININTPEDYAAARRRPPPEITLNGRPTLAATLGEALGLALPSQIILNGEVITAAAGLPLVTGDAVSAVPDRRADRR